MAKLGYGIFFGIFLILFFVPVFSADEINLNDSRKPIIYMLDFRSEDYFVISLFENDRVLVSFDDSSFYKFEVVYAGVYDYIVISLDGAESYLIEWGDRGYFDFDNDGQRDLEIMFLDKEIKWSKLGDLSDKSGKLPKFQNSLERPSEFSLSDFFKNEDYLILLVWIFVIILMVFTFYFFRKKS